MANQGVVLISGASSGVGHSTAQLLAHRGYKVFGTSRNPGRADSMPGVEMLPLDVRVDDSVRARVEAVSNRCGRVDVLINNAGYELGGAVEELTTEEARAQFETNFFGVVRMVTAVLPFMRRQKRGRIINVSSLSGLSAGGVGSRSRPKLSCPSMVCWRTANAAQCATRSCTPMVRHH